MGYIEKNLFNNLLLDGLHKPNIEKSAPEFHQVPRLGIAKTAPGAFTIGRVK